MEAEFAFGVSSSCKGSWVQRRVRTRVERLMLRRSRAEREGGSLVEGCTLTKNGFGSQEPALWEESRVVGGRTSEKRHQSEGREATLLVLLLYVRSEYSGPSGGSWVGVLAASSKDITRGRRTAASMGVVRVRNVISRRVVKLRYWYCCCMCVASTRALQAGHVGGRAGCQLQRHNSRTAYSSLSSCCVHEWLAACPR